MAVGQIDRTLVDIHVVDDDRRQSVGRPWITLAMDVATRCILGFHLSLEAPGGASVAACIAHACLPKEKWLRALDIKAEWPLWGLPERTQADNAREFRTDALSRGCDKWGIRIDWRPVGRPHYGGHIERLIGTLMGRIHLLPGTTQSNPQAARTAFAPESTIMDELHKVAVTRLGDRIRVGGMAELRATTSRSTRIVGARSNSSSDDLFPEGGDVARAEFWAGLRPMTPDGTPILGPTRVKNMWLATGHGTLGVDHGGWHRPAASRLDERARAGIDTEGLTLARYATAAQTRAADAMEMPVR